MTTRKRQCETKMVKRVLLACVLLLATLFGLAACQAPDIEDLLPLIETLIDELENAPVEEADAGWIQVYFTQPQYPDDPANHHGGLDEIVAADLALATRSIDVAAYEFNLESLAGALIDARGRGVEVRFVTDSDNVEERAVQRLVGAGIPVVEDERGAIMHDKFLVIDGAVVWTGSWNLTENGTYRNNNNAVRIESRALAENYTGEFEEMFVDRLFGPDSPANTAHPEVMITGGANGEVVRVENYFAPEDQVGDVVLGVVGEAQESIRFLAFSFTDDALGDLVKAKSKAGVLVQGVFESRGSDTEYSEYGKLHRARPPLDVLLDANPYIMHDKVFILDEETVILGSYNFTSNADNSNDENLLVIHSPEVAALYLQEFERIYQAAASQ